MPAQVRDAFRAGAESLAVKLLAAGCARDEAWLTDIVFHAGQPELRGRGTGASLEGVSAHTRLVLISPPGSTCAMLARARGDTPGCPVVS